MARSPVRPQVSYCLIRSLPLPLTLTAGPATTLATALAATFGTRRHDMREFTPRAAAARAALPLAADVGRLLPLDLDATRHVLCPDLALTAVDDARVLDFRPLR